MRWGAEIWFTNTETIIPSIFCARSNNFLIPDFGILSKDDDIEYSDIISSSKSQKVFSVDSFVGLLFHFLFAVLFLFY